jgi:hypothetical protein
MESTIKTFLKILPKITQPTVELVNKLILPLFYVKLNIIYEEMFL